MKIIDRYIGSSVIATALFGVVVLSLVLVLGNLFKQLLDVLINNPDVPIATVLAFMALVLPFSLTFTIPWGFLTALLLVFGRISADNELVALKSNGVSVPRIAAPRETRIPRCSSVPSSRLPTGRHRAGLRLRHGLRD